MYQIVRTDSRGRESFALKTYGERAVVEKILGRLETARQWGQTRFRAFAMVDESGNIVQPSEPVADIIDVVRGIETGN
jgi:hypothetical protein